MSALRGPLRSVATFVTFSALSVFGYHVLFGHLAMSESFPLFNESVPKISNTGVKGVDDQLDVLVRFFQYDIEPGTAARQHAIGFWASLSVWVAILELEGVRRGSSLLMRLTFLWGILYQVLGGAVISPLYFASLLCLYPSPKSREIVISPAGAQGVLLAMVCAYLPCALGMFVVGGWNEVAIFQFFPIFIWLLKTGYLAAFGKATEKADTKTAEVEDNRGYFQTQLLYLILSIASTAVHVYYVVGPALASDAPFQFLKNFFVPWFIIPGPEHADMQNAVHHLFQWDLIVIIGSAFLAGVWDFGWGDIEMAALWFAQATVVLGPGTALAGIWAYRELLMKNSRVKAAQIAKEAAKKTLKK